MASSKLNSSSQKLADQKRSGFEAAEAVKSADNHFFTPGANLLTS